MQLTSYPHSVRHPSRPERVGHCDLSEVGYGVLSTEETVNDLEALHF
jgi:hypothetical protein